MFADLTTRELAAFGLGALVTIGAFNTGVAHARMVPSGSMAPTFEPGDRIMVQAAGLGRVKRGDILVFRAPFTGLPGAPADDSTYVKRAVGLPGDRVEVRKGVGVLVNGVRVAEPYVAEPPKYGWGPQTVPAGKLFMLGDNRNDSFDSHYWGFLPVDRVIGKSAAVIWPPAHWKRF